MRFHCIESKCYTDRESTLQTPFDRLTRVASSHPFERTIYTQKQKVQDDSMPVIEAQAETRTQKAT